MPRCEFVGQFASQAIAQKPLSSEQLEPGELSDRRSHGMAPVEWATVSTRPVPICTTQEEHGQSSWCSRSRQGPRIAGPAVGIDWYFRVLLGYAHREFGRATNEQIAWMSADKSPDGC